VAIPARGGNKSRSMLIKTVQVSGALFAVLVATIAVLGSGYLDDYILSSDNQASIITGISLYNK